MRRTFRYSLFIAFLLVCSVGFGESGQFVEKEFPAKSGQKIKFDLRPGGSVDLRGWEKSLISVKADLRGRDSKHIGIDMNPVPEGLEIISRYTGGGNNYSSNVRYTVMVPRNFNADIRSSGGEITIEDLKGSVQGKTGGGTITIENSRGNIFLTTGGGEIRIARSHLDGQVSTGGGDVLFEDVTGNIEGSTGGGQVTRRDTKEKAIEIDDAPDGRVELSTGGGSIHVESARYVDVSTGGGDIRIDSLAGSAKATTGAGDIVVRVTEEPASGKGDIHLSSGSGDITISVPANFSMDLDLEVAYTREGRGYDIDSAFPLKIETDDEWDSSLGTPRKYIFGTGSFAGAKHKVRVKTVNGSIIVRKN